MTATNEPDRTSPRLDSPRKDESEDILRRVPGCFGSFVLFVVFLTVPEIVGVRLPQGQQGLARLLQLIQTKVNVGLAPELLALALRRSEVTNPEHARDHQPYEKRRAADSTSSRPASHSNLRPLKLPRLM